MADANKEVVIRFVGADAGLNNALGGISKGFGQAAQGANEFNKSIKALAQTDLAKTLNTSYGEAQKFASALGLSAGQANTAIARLRELNSVGATNAQTYRALRTELGIGRQAYEQLTQVVGQLDAKAKASEERLRNTGQAVTTLAQGLRSSYSSAQQFAQALGLDAQKAGEALTRLRELNSVGATTQQKFAVLSSELGINEQQFAKLNRAAAVTQTGLAGLAGASGAVAAAVGAVAVKGAQQFLEYDKAIRTFGVVTESSGTAQLAALNEEIQKLGANSTKTPQEIANLAIELGRAGFSAEQTTQALGGIVLASQATGEDLTKIGEVVGNVINQFGLSAKDSTKIADLLTAASNASAAGASDLGEALSYVGAQAKASNQSLDDTLLALGTLANAGIKGSSAGTGLAEALRRIKLVSAGAATDLDLVSKASKKGVAAFNLLQANVRNADGSLKPFPEILKQVQTALQGVSQGDKDLILDSLFGTQGGRTVATIIGANTEQVNGLKKALDESAGSAAKAGEELLQGPAASLQQLQSAIGTALTKIGGVVATALTPVLQGATLLIRTFNDLPAPIQTAVVAIGGFAGALAAAVAAIASYNLAMGTGIAQQTLLAAAVVRDTVVTAANTAAKLAQTEVTLAGVGAATASAAAMVRQAAATASAAVASGTLTASLAAVLPPLLAIGAAIAAANFIKFTNDLRVANDSIEAFQNGAQASGDAAILLASKIKAVNDARAQGKGNTAEDVAKQKQLLELSKQQITSLEEQLKAVQEFKPANAEQANSQKAIIANLQASIGALKGQTSELEKNLQTEQSNTTTKKKAIDASKERKKSAEEEADAIKKAREADKVKAEAAFQDTQQKQEQGFQDTKLKQEQAFADQQQVKEQQFQADKEKRQQSFDDAKNQREQQFQTDKEKREQAFAQQQQAADRAYQAQKQQAEDQFKTEQQTKENNFKKQQQAEEASFKESQRQRDAQQQKNFTEAERLVARENADAETQAALDRQKKTADAIANLNLTDKILDPQAIVALAKQVTGISQITTDAQRKQVADAVSQIQDAQKNQQAEADRQAEAAFQEQQRQAEAAFQLQQRTEEQAFKAQQQQADIAYEAQKQAAELAFKDGERQKDLAFKAQELEQERAFKESERQADIAFKQQQQQSDRAFKAQEQESERAFKAQQQEAERNFKQEQRQLDEQSAEKVKSILESAKSPTTPASPPGRRTGGPVQEGQIYRVGEGGWEYFVPNQSGYILNHQEALRLATASLTTLPSVSVTPGTGGGNRSANRLLKEIQEMRKDLFRARPLQHNTFQISATREEAIPSAAQLHLQISRNNLKSTKL